MSDNGLLYKKVTKVTEEYFGPAAPRFIDRLIANHLHKAPEKLTHKDMPELIEWTRITVALLSEDDMIVNEFTERLSLLNGH